MVVRGKKALDDLARYVFSVLQALPQFVGRWKNFKSLFDARREIVLDNSVTVGRVGKLQAKYLSVFLSLAEAIGRFLVIGLSLNDCDGEVRPIAKKVVRPFLFSPDRPV